MRQVSLAVDPVSPIQKIAEKYDADISVLDCKDFNTKGMMMLIDIAAPKEKLDDVTEDLRKTGFKKLYSARSGSSRSLCVAVLDRPPICQAVLDAGALCVTCPYNGESKARWKILVRDSDTLRTLLTKLERQKVSVKIADVSNVSQDDELTARQREVLSKAISLGFYEFPRKIDLTSLSKTVNIKPSTLSEILRNAERKILAHYGDRYSLTRKSNEGF
ncbi:MAG: helix-turn-helix domain-containing protein [Thaumarchaeota archaeon]|nr:helix-turn-helix domain-containing protein [Nitrososphaerota archaeon]